MEIFERGESIKLVLTLKDDDDNVVDISILDNLKIRVYHLSTGDLLEEGTYGVDNVICDDESSGIVYFPIEDSLTLLAAVGVYSCELTAVVVDNDFEDNDLKVIQTQKAFKLR